MDIKFPAGTAPGARSQESAGRLINCYAEALEEGSGRVIRSAPGLRRFGTAPASGYRGGILVGGLVYAAFAESAHTFNSAGATDPAGILPGTGKVFFARNNKLVPDLVAVTETGAYVFGAGPSWAPYPDGDLPSSVAGVVFLDGYFFFWLPDGRMFASKLNSTDVAAEDVAVAESSPDSLLRLAAVEGQLVAFGANSLEVWSGNPPNLTEFPFSRIATRPRGICGPHAATGFEPGFGMGLYWVGDDSAVYRLDGYEPTRISTNDLERLIERVADKTTVEMFSYVERGHPCVAVRCPAWTWVCDLKSGKWHERQSYTSTTWRAVGNSVLAFGKWLVGDAGDGLFEITEGTRREDGEPLVFGAISMPSRGFPKPVRVDEAHFAFVAGVGDASGAEPMQTQPRARISWSNDGGANFSQPVERELGRQGATNNRVSVYRTGTAGYLGRVWKVEVSDHVYVGLLGGTMVTA